MIKTGKMKDARKALGYVTPFDLREKTEEEKAAIYWVIVEAFDWDKNCHANTTQVKRKMLQYFDASILIAVGEFVNRKRGELYKIVDDYEKRNDVRVGDYGGDDSFGDMLHHAIGMGKDYYDSVCADPTVLNDLKAKESFSYVQLRSDEEYDYDVHEHTRKAYELWGRLNFHKDDFIEAGHQEVWAKLAVRFDKVMEAINENVEPDMQLLWEAVGDLQDKKVYSELYDGISCLYANILSDMCCKLFDWDEMGEVQLELDL